MAIDPTLIESALSLSSTYVGLIDKINSFLKRKRGGYSTDEQRALEVFERLKGAAPAENVKNLNPAQIALSSEEIGKKSSEVIRFLEFSNLTRNRFSSSELKEILEKPVEIQKKALELSTAAEKATTPSDINEMATNYLQTANEAQVMAMELEIATKELQKNEEEVHKSSLDKLSHILDSVGSKLNELPKRLIGKAKEAGEQMKSAFEKLPKNLEELGDHFTEKIAKFLKNMLEKLADFWAALVGAMFDFASWVQNIATKKNFSIKEFGIEVPSTEVSVIMIGIIPIPIPKFQTPKLTISFAPS